jgi:hypothetical protein
MCNDLESQGIYNQMKDNQDIDRFKYRNRYYMNNYTYRRFFPINYEKLFVKFETF